MGIGRNDVESCREVSGNKKENVPNIWTWARIVNPQAGNLDFGARDVSNSPRG